MNADRQRPRPGLERPRLTLAVSILAVLAVVACRLLAPSASWPWAATGVAAIVALAAGLATLVLLAAGLRGGRDAASVAAAAMATLGGGFLGQALGVEMAVPALAVSTGWLAVAAAGARRERRRAWRGPTIRLAVGSFAAAEMTLAILAVLGTDEVLRGPLAVAAAALAVLAAMKLTDRASRSGALLLAVAAALLAVARPDAPESLLVATLMAGALALLAAGETRAAHESASADEAVRLPDLARHVSEAILLFDGGLRLADWNGPAATLLQLGPSAAGGRLEDLLGAPLGRLRRARGDALLTRAPGTGAPLSVSLLSHRGGLLVVAGRPEGTARSALDPGSEDVERLGRELRATLDELAGARRTVELQRAELDRVASADALTGLPERRAILERLVAEVAQARRYDHCLSLALVDVDGLAILNHLNGVEAGDAVLREIALRLRLRTRAADAVGRLDGDTFLAVLPHTDEAGAARHGDALRRIAARPIHLPSGPVAVTVSVGIAVLRAGEWLDADGALARAEEALASAQAAGGDRVALDRQHGLARLEPGAAEPSAASAAEVAKPQDTGS